MNPNHFRSHRSTRFLVPVELRHLASTLLIGGSALWGIACQPPTSPGRENLSITADRATFVVQPESSRALVDLSLRIENKSGTAAQIGCGFGLQRETEPKQFADIFPAACALAAAEGITVGAHASYVLNLTFSVDAGVINEKSRYRAVIPLGFENSSGAGVASEPFTISRQ